MPSSMQNAGSPPLIRRSGPRLKRSNSDPNMPTRKFLPSLGSDVRLRAAAAVAGTASSEAISVLASIGQRGTDHFNAANGTGAKVPSRSFRLKKTKSVPNSFVLGTTAVAANIDFKSSYDEAVRNKQPRTGMPGGRELPKFHEIDRIISVQGETLHTIPHREVRQVGGAATIIDHSALLPSPWLQHQPIVIPVQNHTTRVAGIPQQAVPSMKKRHELFSRQVRKKKSNQVPPLPSALTSVKL